LCAVLRRRRSQVHQAADAGACMQSGDLHGIRQRLDKMHRSVSAFNDLWQTPTMHFHQRGPGILPPMWQRTRRATGTCLRPSSAGMTEVFTIQKASR